MKHPSIYTKAERFRTKRLSFIRALYLNEMLRRGKLKYAGSNTTGSMTRSELITISKYWIISQRSKIHRIVKMSKVLNLESSGGSTLEAKPPLNLRLRSGSYYFIVLLLYAMLLIQKFAKN